MLLHCSVCNARTPRVFSFFFFNDTATTEIYTLSLHDALPISTLAASAPPSARFGPCRAPPQPVGDRKSTRLNSSHSQISYAVFCLKKKNKKKHQHHKHAINSETTTSIAGVTVYTTVDMKYKRG